MNVFFLGSIVKELQKKRTKRINLKTDNDQNRRGGDLMYVSQPRPKNFTNREQLIIVRIFYSFLFVTWWLRYKETVSMTTSNIEDSPDHDCLVWPIYSSSFRPKNIYRTNKVNVHIRKTDQVGHTRTSLMIENKHNPLVLTGFFFWPSNNEAFIQIISSSTSEFILSIIP